MGKDLDKLMKKLKTTEKPTEEKPTEEKVDLEKDDLNDDDEEKVDEGKPIPANEENVQSIEGEVAVLQNDGVFRRELILTLKELVDVHKINTQTLLDIKKKFDEGDDGKGE